MMQCRPMQPVQPIFHFLCNIICPHTVVMRLQLKKTQQTLLSSHHLVISTAMPSCFMVARTDAAETTALSQVEECARARPKRRKRIVDEPLALDFNQNIIHPSRCASQNNLDTISNYSHVTKTSLNLISVP